MKRVSVLFLLIAWNLTAVNGQEKKVVVPDSLKITADSLKIPADSLKISADSIKIHGDSLVISSDSVKIIPEATKAAPQTRMPKNFVKFNVTSALIKNFELQYERVLSKSISMALSFNIMPETKLPFSDLIINWADITDPEEQEVIENLITGNFTVTPEVRFYLGKKRYGTGFYISLFYMYGQYTVSNVKTTFESSLGEDVTIDYSANVASSHTGGFMLGAQWALGKRFSLDWWIMGPHFGVSSGDVLGIPSIPLTPEDQQDIEDNLNDIDIPMFEQTVEVTADKATMIFDGPWGGIRAGLLIGVRF